MYNFLMTHIEKGHWCNRKVSDFLPSQDMAIIMVTPH